MKRETNTKKVSKSETNECIKKVPSWKDIEAKVITPFDLSDKSQEYGYKEWLKYAKRIRYSEMTSDIIHNFKSREVYEALVSYFISDIEENIARYRLKLSRNNCQNKIMLLTSALGEHDTVFIDEDNGEKLVPELLGIAHVTKEKIYRRILETSKSLAISYSEGKMEEITWPIGAGALSEFTDEMTSFIKSSGDEGRELVIQICEDNQCARDIYSDEDMLKPLRFLAQMSLEVNKNILVKKKKRAIGFNHSEERSA